MIRKIKHNPKAFWKYASSKRQTRTGINNLNRNDGSRAQDDKDKAETLNNLFSNVYTEEDQINVPQLHDKYLGDNPLACGY